MKNINKIVTLEKMLQGTTPADFALTEEDREWLDSTVGRERIDDDAYVVNCKPLETQTKLSQ